MSIHIKKLMGFTLLELVIFIVISAVVIVAVFSASKTGIMSAADTSDQITANMIGQQCMEWLVGERRLIGYNTLSCPSTPTGTLCNSPTGFTVTPSVACTTLGSDTNFKTIKVIVSGRGDITLQTLIANY